MNNYRRFEIPKPPSENKHEPLGLNRDQVDQLTSEIIDDLREAKVNPCLPQAFYVTQNALFNKWNTFWRIIYFRVDDANPAQPKLVRGDLDTGDHPYALDLASGSESIKSALNDRYVYSRPLTQLQDPPLRSSPNLKQGYLDHHQAMEQSASYINRKLADLKTA